MKTYEKPVVLVNEELAEGVYAASGEECYTVATSMHQEPQEGRIDYRIQLNATHSAADEHHSGQQRVQISFNMAVEFVSCSNATAHTGSGSSVLTVDFAYHNNPSEYIGLGELVVTADAGLAITSAVCTYCNRSCGQH